MTGGGRGSLRALAIGWEGERAAVGAPPTGLVISHDDRIRVAALAGQGGHRHAQLAAGRTASAML